MNRCKSKIVTIDTCYFRIDVEHSNKNITEATLLAGGIAHDFNNILAAIMGYIEMSRNSSIKRKDRNIFRNMLKKKIQR